MNADSIFGGMPSVGVAPQTPCVDNRTSEPALRESTLEDFRLQYWLTPPCLPWNVWDTWTANAVTMASV